MSLQDVLGHMDLATFPQVAMLLFLGVFLAVSWRALLSGRAECERAARLPLDELRTVAARPLETSDV